MKVRITNHSPRARRLFPPGLVSFPAAGMVLSLGLVSCGGGDHSSHGGAAAAESLPPVAVALQPVEMREITIHEEVPGTVQPKLQASVAPKVTGRILEMRAIPGTRVEKGDLLVELEVSDLRAALDRAEAGLERAKADLERYQTLTPGRSVSKAEVDRVKAEHSIAEATFNETKRRIEYAEIKAPFAGLITRRYLDAGDLATPTKAIFKIEDPAHLRLELNVAESLAGAIEMGQAFGVRIGSAGEDIEGKVSEMEPSGDPGSRTFMVKLDLPDTDNVRPGQFGRAFLPRGKREAILVPAEAVIERGQLSLVFVDDDGKTGLRIVRPGRRIDGDVEILSGLEAGDVIVAAPEPGLREGQPIESKGSQPQPEAK